MLVKFDSYVCNMLNVNRFHKSPNNKISFEFIDVSKAIEFSFKSEEERDNAFDLIIDAYRKDIKVCFLD